MNSSSIISEGIKEVLFLCKKIETNKTVKVSSYIHTYFYRLIKPNFFVLKNKILNFSIKQTKKTVLNALKKHPSYIIESIKTVLFYFLNEKRLGSISQQK